jgi:hypothetical protein
MTRAAGVTVRFRYRLTVLPATVYTEIPGEGR